MIFHQKVYNGLLNGNESPFQSNLQKRISRLLNCIIHHPVHIAQVFNNDYRKYFGSANGGRVENLWHPVTAGAWRQHVTKYFSLFPKSFLGFDGDSRMMRFSWMICNRFLNLTNYSRKIWREGMAIWNFLDLLNIFLDFKNILGLSLIGFRSCVKPPTKESAFSHSLNRDWLSNDKRLD